MKYNQYMISRDIFCVNYRLLKSCEAAIYTFNDIPIDICLCQLFIYLECLFVSLNVFSLLWNPRNIWNNGTFHREFEPFGFVFFVVLHHCKTCILTFKKNVHVFSMADTPLDFLFGFVLYLFRISFLVLICIKFVLNYLKL